MNLLFARTAQIVIDVLILCVALWLAFMVRFDWALPHYWFKRMVISLPYVVVWQYLLLLALGVPRFAWRFIGLREMLRIGAALGASVTAMLALRALAIQFNDRTPYAQHLILPLGVVAIDLTFSFLGIVGARVAWRVVVEKLASERRARGARQVLERTLIIGAGEVGSHVAREVAVRPDLGIRAVGFLDDNKMKVGTTLHGLTVLGTTDDIERHAALSQASQALIAISGASGQTIRKIVEKCDAAGLPTKIVPGVHEIIGGQVNLSRIRDVDITDLLRREPVELDSASIHRVVRGRVVMVTGAGGSIGSELCRQVGAFGPTRLVLVEQAEGALFQIHGELARTMPNISLAPSIADITDNGRMRHLFAEHKPQVVFHAAAHKHVPMMEWNPGEAVKNNVLGTKQLADLADEHGVSEFVMVSTDKAVNPTSVMGASKRVAEIYIQALSSRSRTRFLTVRFGNVLGSAGSVIPIFQEQIARGGPVMVTHPEMMRYFMTIPEATQLILQAASLGEGGEIFILDMGHPVKIVDLASDLIALSGLRTGEDIEIQFSGIRPGEKLFEELNVAEEEAAPTSHSKIFVHRGRTSQLDQIEAQIRSLASVANHSDAAEVRRLFSEIVPEYQEGRYADPRSPPVVEPGSQPRFGPN